MKISNIRYRDDFRFACLSAVLLLCAEQLYAESYLNIYQQRSRVIDLARTETNAGGTPDLDTGWIDSTYNPNSTTASGTANSSGSNFYGSGYAQSDATATAGWDIAHGWYLYGNGSRASVAEVHSNRTPSRVVQYYEQSARTEATALTEQAVSYNGAFAYYFEALITEGIGNGYNKIYSGITGEFFQRTAYRSGFLSGQSSFTVQAQFQTNVYALSGGEISDQTASNVGGWSYNLFIVPLPRLPTFGLDEAHPITVPLSPAKSAPPGLSPTGDFYLFEGGLAGMWFDPAPSSELFYRALDGTTFDAIRAPSFGSNLILESEDGSVVYDGSFGNGKIFRFDSPVTGFRIAGFGPNDAAGEQGGFPLEAFFTDGTGSFAMSSLPFSSSPVSPVPEASSFACAGSLFLFVLLLGKRMKWV